MIGTRDAMALKMGSLWLTPRQMMGVLDDATSGVPLSLGAGTPGFVALPGTAVELAGMALDAADQISDLLPVDHLSRPPHAVDWTRPMYARWFGSSSGGTGDTGVIGTLHMKGVLAAVLGDVTSSADISKAFAAVTTPAAAIPFKSQWAKLETSNLFVLDDFIQTSFTATAIGDASADEIKLIGIQLMYYYNPFTASGIDESP